MNEPNMKAIAEAFDYIAQILKEQKYVTTREVARYLTEKGVGGSKSDILGHLLFEGLINVDDEKITMTRDGKATYRLLQLHLREDKS
jgi:Mn-dependent DtxR family transcriptional regulator